MAPAYFGNILLKIILRWSGFTTRFKVCSLYFERVFSLLFLGIKVRLTRLNQYGQANSDQRVNTFNYSAFFVLEFLLQYLYF